MNKALTQPLHNKGYTCKISCEDIHSHKNTPYQYDALAGRLIEIGDSTFIMLALVRSKRRELSNALYTFHTLHLAVVAKTGDIILL